jgi:hypothetical protein
MVAREPPWVDFHAGFDVVRIAESVPDEAAQPPDFVRVQKRGRAAAEMELDDLARGIQPWRHLRQFTAEGFDVGFALVMVERDDGGAAAKPAERFAERDVKIQGQVAGAAVVGLHARGDLGPGHRVGKLCRGRIAGVTRAGHVVFLHQFKIDL